MALLGFTMMVEVLAAGITVTWVDAAGTTGEAVAATDSGFTVPARRSAPSTSAGLVAARRRAAGKAARRLADAEIDFELANL